MRNILFFVIGFFCLTSFAAANDVYLSTGYVYRSVKIDTSGSVALIDMESRIDTIPKSIILKNERTAYHNLGRPRLTEMTADENDYFKKKQTPPVRPAFKNPALTPRVESPSAEKNTDWATPHSNGVFITIGILGAVTAWDQFSLASKYQDGSDKTRSYIVGAAAAVVGVAFTVYALTPVSVSVSPDKLTVAYNF